MFPFTKTPIKPFLDLGKHRLSFMNALMPVAGYISCAPSISAPVALALFGGNFFMALSSQGMGQIIEKKQDSLMARTKDRPLVVHSITDNQATKFTLGSYLLANAIMIPTIPMSAVLTSNLTVALYYVYLKAKQRTKHCIHIGAIVGIMPLLVGGLAAGELTTKLFLDMAFMYSWQISHFVTILNHCQQDYKNAGFVMPEGSAKLLNMIIRYLVISGLIVYQLSDDDIYHVIIKVMLEMLIFTKAYHTYRKLKGLPYPKILGRFFFDYYSIAGFYYLGYNLVPPAQGKRIELHLKNSSNNGVAEN